MIRLQINSEDCRDKAIFWIYRRLKKEVIEDVYVLAHTCMRGQLKQE